MVAAVADHEAPVREREDLAGIAQRLVLVGGGREDVGDAVGERALGLREVELALDERDERLEVGLAGRDGGDGAVGVDDDEGGP